jgi:hypothetical protein
VVAETAVVHNAPRSVPGTPSIFATNYKAVLLAKPEGLQVWPYRYADKWMFEDRLDQNPPRAARVYALIGAVQFDAFIASQDGKFTYWYIRPPQLDPAIVPLFPVPKLPKLPVQPLDVLCSQSGRAAYLFPTRADYYSRRRQGSRRFKNLGRHSLPDGQRRRCSAWGVRCRALHPRGRRRWVAVENTPGS